MPFRTEPCTPVDDQQRLPNVVVFVAMPPGVDVFVHAVMRDETRLMQVATAIRLTLLAWGSFQDHNFEVPYTDIDLSLIHI